MKKRTYKTRKKAKRIFCLAAVVLLSVSAVPLPTRAESIIIGETEDTDELLSVEETSIHNFCVTDENGNYLSGAGFELYDENGTLIAAWESGKEAEAVSERLLDNLPVTLAYQRDTYTKLIGENGNRIGAVKVDDTGMDWRSLFQYGTPYDNISDMGCTLHLGENYTFSYKYSKPYEPTYTLPANKAGIYISENYNKATNKYGERDTIALSSDNVFYTMTLSESLAGTLTTVDIVKDDEGLFWCNSAPVFPSAGETHYVKRTCKLADLLRSIFSHRADHSTIAGYEIKEIYDNGTMLACVDSFFQHSGKEYPDSIINLAEYGVTLADGYKIWPRLTIWSGSMINEVVPDADGNVTLYLSTDTDFNKCNCNFSMDNTNVSGGATHGGTLYADEWVEASIPFSVTKVAPEDGLTLFLDRGNYTLKQTYAPNGYEKSEDVNFSIDYGSKRPVLDRTITVTNNKKAEEPTTESPTTEEPTTENPTTEAPATEEPTTEAPTTDTPVTTAPTTETTPAQTPADNGVKTGDTTPIHIVFICLMTSLAVILVLTSKRLNRKNK